jgi:hypothetical protein
MSVKMERCECREALERVTRVAFRGFVWMPFILLLCVVAGDSDPKEKNEYSLFTSFEDFLWPLGCVTESGLVQMCKQCDASYLVVLLGVEKAPGKTGSMYTCEDISGSNVERRARVYRCNNR